MARTARQGGLGRGLSAIIPTVDEPAARVPAIEPPPDGVAHRAVEAGLRAVAAALDADLVAYLHLGEGTGPRLHLHRPTLAELSPSEAFELFAALSDRLWASEPGGHVTLGRWPALVIPSAGAASRGLHIVGRTRLALDRDESEQAADLCRALGEVAHALDARDHAVPAPRLLRVGAEVGGDGVRAEVKVAWAGEPVAGTATASSSLAAAAGAVLDAVGDGRVLGRLRQCRVGGYEVVMALVGHLDGDPLVGSALRGNDPLHAAALATLRALDSAAC